MIAADTGIAGSELSCYTIAVAALLESLGIEHERAIGAQLYTAVREEDAGSEPSPLGFVHHHTPLRAERLGVPDLVRRSAASWAEAVEALRGQVAAHGAVIVVGDTFNLPWQNACGRTHAPHWFVIDAFSDGACHVVDLLEFDGQFGPQAARRGWHPVAGLVDLARAADYGAGKWFQVRERHALGDLEDDRIICTPHRYHWYEATIRGDGGSTALEVLRDTVRHHGGGAVRPDLAAAGWTCGLPALRLLERRFEERLGSPELYDAGADLWVAARTRSLFTRTCDGVGAARRDPRFGQLAEWCREHLLWRWAAVPRVMEYNRSALARGRPPRALLPQLLGEIADAETELVDRLARLVLAERHGPR
ncbi:MAG TPA: hypothetical protein VOB72_16435 [Candidatus Dormibacteraeota bacterium]|nr:hypothetical protein [Candidatus Dormibacteraeota bacterium]